MSYEIDEMENLCPQPSTTSAKSFKLTHYKRFYFDADCEIQFIFLHFPIKSDLPTDAQTSLKSDTVGCVIKNEINFCSLYFTVVGGRGESCGILFQPRKLYKIDLNKRFLFQTFNGLDLCFLSDTNLVFSYKHIYNDPKISHAKNNSKSNFNSLQDAIIVQNTNDFELKLSDFNMLTQLTLNESNNYVKNKDFNCHEDGDEKQTNIEYRLYCDVRSFKANNLHSGRKQSTWPYKLYTHLAFELNRLRTQAKNTNQFGPRLIILGPCDSGKSTLAKILINYAIQDHWCPMFVDLDLGQGVIGLPGNIGAGVVDKQCWLNDNFQFKREHQPLMVQYGQVTTDSDCSMYNMAVSCLSQQVYQSMEINSVPTVTKPKRPTNKPSAKHSGMIINTHGWIFGNGYRSTMDAIKEFSVTHVCVLSDYKLYERVRHDLIGPPKSKQYRQNSIPNGSFIDKRSNSSTNVGDDNQSIKVSFYSHNFSIKKRNSNLRRQLRMSRIKNHFQRQPLSTVTVSVSFDNHPIFRLFSFENFQKFSSMSDVDTKVKNDRWKIQSTSTKQHTAKIRKHSYNNKACYNLRCKVGNYDQQMVFYHIKSETLVYLLERILTILWLPFDQLLANDNRLCLLKNLLLIRSYARVVQIDLEAQCIHIEIPRELETILRDGNLVLVVNEISYDDNTDDDDHDQS